MLYTFNACFCVSLTVSGNTRLRADSVLSACFFFFRTVIDTNGCRLKRMITQLLCLCRHSTGASLVIKTVPGNAFVGEFTE